MPLNYLDFPSWLCAGVGVNVTCAHCGEITRVYVRINQNVLPVNIGNVNVGPGVVPGSAEG